MTWNKLLNALQVRDTFTFQRGPSFSWNNGQKGQAKRLARLDRFYTPANSKLEINQKAYFIHRYSVGSDHSLRQVDVSIGSSEVRKATFK